MNLTIPNILKYIELFGFSFDARVEFREKQPREKESGADGYPDDIRAIFVCFFILIS